MPERREGDSQMATQKQSPMGLVEDKPRVRCERERRMGTRGVWVCTNGGWRGDRREGEKSCKFTLCGALGSHGHCLAVAPCSGPLGSPSGSEGEPWGDSWPWCLGPGDSAALAHVGGNRRGVDLF